MQRLPLLPLVIACCTLLLPSVVCAADAAVFLPEISNLSPEDASTVANLIAQAYATESQQTVVPPSAAQAALEPGQTYEATAAKLGVNEYIRLSTVAAGTTFVITASRFQADGKLVKQTKHTANGVAGVAQSADGIAKALLGHAAPAAALSSPAVAVVETFEPEQKRDAEKPPATKQETDNFYGFKTALHIPLAKGADYPMGVSVQFNGRLQFPRFFIEFGAGFIVPTVVEDRYYDEGPCSINPSTGQTICPGSEGSNRGYLGGFTTELGASYYLTRGNVAPYVGGGVVPCIVLAGLDNDAHDVASIAAYAQVGFTAPRFGRAHFFMDARLSQAVLAQHLQSGDPVFPTEPSVHVGLGW